jgi:hypothetical protein
MKDTIGHWANKYSNRLLLTIMYKAGEMTLEEVIATTEFNHPDEFLRFVETQLEYGRRLKGKICVKL